MKKNKSLLIVLLLMLAISIAGCFITFDVSRAQTIKASMFDLSAQLSDFQKWKKWDSTLVNPADSISAIVTKGRKQVQTVSLNGETFIKLTIINPALFQLQQGNGPVQAIALLPTDNEVFTSVIWTSKMNGFQWLAAIFFGHDEILEELYQLKNFAQSTKGIYGFPIAIRKVTELIICTKTDSVSSKNFRAYVPEFLAGIRQFLKTNTISIAKNYYYVSCSSTVGENIELTVGIPATKETQSERGIKFLKFPSGGNFLVGTYEGDPAEMQKIYAAMNKYVLDKRLSKVAQPMEKYTDDPATLKTKGNISMQLIYPIY